MQIDLHGLHVEEALTRLEDYLIKLGGLAHPAGILLKVCLHVGHASLQQQAPPNALCEASLQGSCQVIPISPVLCHCQVSEPVVYTHIS